LKITVHKRDGLWKGLSAVFELIGSSTLDLYEKTLISASISLLLGQPIILPSAGADNHHLISSPLSFLLM
jgi:hypothetical protein